VTTANTLSVVGIASTGHSHVEVRGPGTITGFGVGVRLSTGADLNVDGVTITGPTAPVSTDFTLARALTVGVLIDQTSCVVATLAPSFAGVVEFNDISNQTMGVQLSGASCVLVTGNNIHDNAGAQGDSHGIDLIASGNNVISTNIVTRNGANLGVNGGVDGGIMLLNSTSAQNHVWFNYVTNNCGDGITIRNSAHDNNVEGNTALNNSTSTLGGRCVKVQPGTFFDVADRNEGAGNVWNPNNTCKTQGPGIPNGVCP
jgi:nitrous oxidase accessory protein NosD